MARPWYTYRANGAVNRRPLVPYQMFGTGRKMHRRGRTQSMLLQFPYYRLCAGYGAHR